MIWNIKGTFCLPQVSTDRLWVTLFILIPWGLNKKTNTSHDLDKQNSIWAFIKSFITYLNFLFAIKFWLNLHFLQCPPRPPPQCLSRDGVGWRELISLNWSPLTKTNNLDQVSNICKLSHLSKFGLKRAEVEFSPAFKLNHPLFLTIVVFISVNCPLSSKL